VPHTPRPIHLAIALDGAGWHPAAWRDAEGRPQDLFTARYWTDLIIASERALIDFVTIEDGLGMQSDHHWKPDNRTDRVRGRLDAVLIAARVGPLTSNIGLIPSVIATHTEPFHVSKAIATLDYVTSGRAGVRVQVSPRADVAAHFGRRVLAPLAVNGEAHKGNSDLLAEAHDYVEVLRRLWDSWEDDAEIRDVATGRFIDRNKLHYIDFAGAYFSVKGPSITPRPPQGQPIVTALGHVDSVYRFIAASADVGFITPRSTSDVVTITDTVSSYRTELCPDDPTVRVFADVVAFLGDTTDAAASRRARLDDLAGSEFTSDALIFTGTAAELADLVAEWQGAGVAGIRLRPATIPHDLHYITTGLVPELQRRGLFRTAYEAATLRGLLGLGRPDNRYVTTSNQRGSR
jgi:alkanesulfonate monooxygenase SsuD/methylene tetrahydromethanopterin reductase-like flavin-dependent oxidoreductase (luciferase family)